MKRHIMPAIGLTLVPLIGYMLTKCKPKANHKLKNQLYVGVELGGTNFNVAIAEAVLSSQGEIIDFRIIMRKNGTTYQDPQQSLTEIKEFIESSYQAAILEDAEKRSLTFIGIASFGPLCLDANSPDFGAITTTPK